MLSRLVNWFNRTFRPAPMTLAQLLEESKHSRMSRAVDPWENNPDEMPVASGVLRIKGEVTTVAKTFVTPPLSTEKASEPTAPAPRKVRKTSAAPLPRTPVPMTRRAAPHASVPLAPVASTRSKVDSRDSVVDDASYTVAGIVAASSYSSPTYSSSSSCDSGSSSSDSGSSSSSCSGGGD